MHRYALMMFLMGVMPVLAGCPDTAECGDGLLQEFEECDDGNDVNTDACTNECKIAECGDGLVSLGEECDDGNLDNSDACLTTCVDARCGDGQVQVDVEACDDANFDNNDACLNDCQIATCGDGFVRADAEECDDGNVDDADGCRNDCTLPSCGDGVVQAGEECDDGNVNDSDGCLNSCRIARCGDGAVQVGVEGCDDGNADDLDGCRNSCQVATCGDGVVRIGVELCDDGNADDADGCGNDCTLPSCGDGVVQAPEQCDDGNQSDADACSSTCLPAICGDGHRWFGVEACDDGNLDNTDDCRTDCTIPGCGDGFLDVFEGCDDGNSDNSDACRWTCEPATCGDGFVWAGVEDCDDGNSNDSDDCPTGCAWATCGDGFVWTGVEACDDGNADNTDACLDSCERAECGDGFVQAGVEQCDDGNIDNTDGCLADCREFDLCTNFNLASSDVPSACVGNIPATMTLDGSGILIVDGVEPTATIDGVPTTVLSVGGSCSSVLGAFADIQSCSQIQIALPPGLPLGTHEIEITNPISASCSASYIMSVALPPTISFLDPPQVCLDPVFGFTFDVHGTDFALGSIVAIDGIPVQTTFVSTTLLTAFAPPGTIGPGLYDVTVINGGGGCEDTLPLSLTVNDLPIVFFVDPPVVPNLIPVTATAFVTGINGNVVQVEIEEVGTGLRQSMPFQWNPAEPAVIEFDLPTGLPEGFYDLYVTDAVGCVPRLEDAFYVEANTVLQLVSIDPAFGWTNGTTAVTITSTGTPPFENPPRVYLSPLAPGPGTTAAELRAVTYVDGTTVDAVVPAGLSPDDYNVVVVNPNSGDVGILAPPNGFTVVADEPPYVASLAPNTIPSSVTPVFVAGGGFGNPAADPAPVVDLFCYDPTPDNCSSGIGNGVFFNLLSVPVVTWDANNIELSVDGGAVGNGVCTLRVSKTTDGTFGEFAALSVTQPSQNLYDWRQTSAMNTARSSVMAAAGRATRAQRWLYAMGGENAANGVLDSIERARVDSLGELGPWSFLSTPLPSPLRSAGVVRIGRYIYLVGGHDGNNPLSTVWRAQILDPLASPSFTSNLSISVDPIGLPQGSYVYRISALFAPGDDDNPNGESLPSDPFVVRLPDVSPDNLPLTLEWVPVPGASGYRIYRGIAGAGSVEWLTDVVGGATANYTDLGATTDPAGPQPLAPGSLGEWSSMPPLAVPREAPCVAWGQDPSDPTVAYLFVGGGHDGAAPRGDIVYLDIDLIADLDQNANGWATSAQTLAGGRYQCGAYSLTNEFHSRVAPGDTWIYFGGGNGSGSTDVGLVNAGGDFDPAQWYPGVNGPANSAYGFAAASNFIYAFGGDPPVASGRSGELCGPGLNCNAGPPDPPEIRNFNALGTAMCESRGFMGSAQESSVFFVIGGDNGAGATNSVDFTNY
jgi:cysteine-rich repeat protein